MFLVYSKIKMAGDEGFEPPNGGTRTHCLTTWRIPSVPIFYHGISKNAIKIALLFSFIGLLFKVILKFNGCLSKIKERLCKTQKTN